MRTFAIPPLLALPILALAACVQPDANPPAVPGPATCGAASLQGLVGQPRSVLRAMRLPPRTRVIGPGQPVTMDFAPSRLNFEIGPDGRIAKIACY